MHYHQHHNDNTTPLIELNGVSHQYTNRIVLQDVSLTVGEGDFIAITGRNGGGKTTLLRLILRLIRPTVGTVIHHTMPGTDRPLNIGYLPQKNMIDSRFPITVREVITMGLDKRTFKRLNYAQRAQIDDTIALMGLDDVADNPIGDISGGQLQRALLGRAIITEPDLLVMDEPLSYIDKHFERHLYDIIGRLADHITILLVSHDVTTVAQMANRHLIVDRTITECHSHQHFITLSCDIK